MDLYLRLPLEGQATQVLSARFAEWRAIIRSLTNYLKELAQVQDEVVRLNLRMSHAVNFPQLQLGNVDHVNHGVAAGSLKPSDPLPFVYVDGKNAITPTTNGHASHSTHTEPRASAQAAAPAPAVSPSRSHFAPYGSRSVGDVPAHLIDLHQKQAGLAQRSSTQISGFLVPRLEELRRDLGGKIKEIKSLHSDFKNNVAREQATTAHLLDTYALALHVSATNPHALAAKNDPFLLKKAVQNQLARQVEEENYLLEAFINLETSGVELEKVVVQEIQQVLRVLADHLNATEKVSTQWIHNFIDSGFVSQNPDFEWNHLITHDTRNFVPLSLQPRSPDTVPFPDKESPLSRVLREGFLERRSKYLKSYTRGWYILTANFLHELRSPRDLSPITSIALCDFYVTQEFVPRYTASASTASAYAPTHSNNRLLSSHKFILQPLHSPRHSGHNWVFRAESLEARDAWLADLAAVTRDCAPRNSTTIAPQRPLSHIESSSQSSGEHKRPESTHS